MPQGGISGLAGTRVEITAESNRPLSSGELQLLPTAGEGRTLRAHPAAEMPNSVTWEFTIQSAGKLSLSVVDVDGQRSASAISAAILVLKDQRPLVRIVSPKARSFATPDVVLPTRLEAEDDYGISSLALYRSLNGSRHLPDRFPVPIPAASRMQTRVQLLLKDYGLSPGDVITVFGRVTDTDPALPKGSESGTVTITIISREMYDRMVRTQKTVADFQARYLEAARLLRELVARGDELIQAADKEQAEMPSEEMRKGLASFADDLKQASERTRRLAEREPLVALDRDLSQPLREMAGTMSQAAKEVEGARKESSAEMRESLRRALQALRQQQQEYQQQVQEPLEQFAAAFALLEMEQRFLALCDSQKALAERMSNLKGQDRVEDPSVRVRMRDLRDEQRELAAELQLILEEIQRRAQALPEDEKLEKLRQTAQQFARAVEESRALPAMGEAAAALEEFQGTQGSARAKEAADVLERFVGRCQAGAEGAGQACEFAFAPARQPSARLTVGQLLQAGGMGTGYGQVGTGMGGYSMRTAAVPNVGVYGPATLAAGMGESDQDVVPPGFALDATGGDAGKGITPEAREQISYEAIPLQGVPPEHREGVRAYFKRVAEETSSGTVLEETPGAKRKEP